MGKRLEDSFSLYPYFNSSGLNVDVVSNTFPQCDRQYCNGYNGCWDPCTDVNSLSSSYPSPPCTSSSPPWKLIDTLSSWNLLATLSCSLFFLDTVHVHMPHPLSLV
jgi:hypothetical protein